MLNNAAFFSAGSSLPPGSPSQSGAVRSAEDILLPSGPLSFIFSFLSGLAPQSLRVWTDQIFQVASSGPCGGQGENEPYIKHFPGRSLWKLKGSRSGDCTGGGGNGSSPGQSLFEEFDIGGPWCKNLRIPKEAVNQPQLQNMAGGSSGSLPWRKARRTRLGVRRVTFRYRSWRKTLSSFPGFLSPSLFWSFVC